MEAKKANDYKFDISHLNLHYGDFHALFRMWKIYISEDTESYE